jgi:hypothetical protein
LKTNYLKTAFRWLHSIWGIIGAGICILLATARGGHPPGIVFVPLAALIWLAGHVLLWLSRKLAIRGKSYAENRNIALGNWPPMIILLVFTSGIVFIFGLFMIIWQMLFEEDWLRYMTIPLSIWTVSSIGFFGILLRQNWSRILAGSGFIVLAITLLYETLASLMRGYRNTNNEYMMVIAIFILLILIGLYILLSNSIKAYFYKSQEEKGSASLE